MLIAKIETPIGVVYGTCFGIGRIYDTDEVRITDTDGVEDEFELSTNPKEPHEVKQITIYCDGTITDVFTANQTLEAE